MRDIRPDLKARLAAYEHERDRLSKELKALDERTVAAQALLEFEERAHAEAANATKAAGPKSDDEIEAAILNALQRGPMNKDELHDFLEPSGVLVNQASTRRKVHILALNLRQQHKVIKDENGAYTLPKTQNARGLTASERPN